MLRCLAPTQARACLRVATRQVCHPCTSGSVLPVPRLSTVNCCSAVFLSTCHSFHAISPHCKHAQAQPGQKPCLAGGVCSWDATAHTLSEDAKTHHSPITSLVWSTVHTTILSSGDARGRLALWRLEPSSKLVLLMHFDAASPGPVTDVVFGAAPGTDHRPHAACQNMAEALRTCDPVPCFCWQHMQCKACYIVHAEAVMICI